MKKFLMILLVLVTAFSLSACRRDDDDDNGDDNGDTPPTDAELVQDAMNRLSFSNMGAYEAATISMPATLIHGVQVSWSISNEEIVNPNGTVFRPRGDGVDVTLTATFTLNNVTTTKDYLFTIMPLEEIDPSVPFFDDFSALYAAYTDVEDAPNKIVVEGVVAGRFSGGYFLFDGENHLGVFNPGGSVFQLGDKVEVYGSYGQYYTLFQMDRPDQERLVGTGFDYDVTPIDSSISAVHALDSSNPLIHGMHYTVRGTVVERTVGSYDNIYLVEGDLELFIYPFSNRGSLDALEAKAGEYVEINVIYYTDHSRDGIIVAFQGLAADITVITLTDEDRAEIAGQGIDLGNTSEVIGDITLPTTGAYDATITWSSSNTSVVANDGTVTLPLTDSVDVTLTATVKVGTEEYVRTFVVTIMPESYVYTGISVTEALLEADDEVVRVEGVVTSYPAFVGNPGFFIQDDDGTAIFVNTDLAVEVGNKVVIRGKLDTYDSFSNIRRQLNDATLLSNDDGDHAIVVITNKSLNDIASDISASQSIRFRVENAVFIEMQGNFFTFETNDAVKLIIHSGSYGQHLLGTLTAGDTVNWIEFTVYDLFEGDLRGEGVVFADLTLLETKALAESRLDVSGTKSVDVSLPSELVVKGINYNEADLTYAVTWSSSNTAVITDAGVITRPAIGEPNVDATMTATFTVDSEVVTLDFVVTIRAMQEVVEGTLAYDFNFSLLSNATTYVTTPTVLDVLNIVDSAEYGIERLNANISTQGEYTGIVLGIRGGNNFEDAYLRTDFKVENLVKIDFSWINWTSDFDYNFNDFIVSVEVQMSTDNVSWTTIEDITDKVDTGISANNAFSIQVAGTPGPVYIRIYVTSKDNLNPDPSWASVRFIIQSLKLYTE